MTVSYCASSTASAHLQHPLLEITVLIQSFIMKVVVGSPGDFDYDGMPKFASTGLFFGVCQMSSFRHARRVSLKAG